MQWLFNHPVTAALIAAGVAYAIGVAAIGWRTR